MLRITTPEEPNNFHAFVFGGLATTYPEGLFTR